MIIDCDGCAVRGVACGECAIGVLLGSPEPAAAPHEGVEGCPEVPPGAPIVQLDAAERQALAVLADQGLVPRLRLVAVPTRRTLGESADGGAVCDAG